MRPAMSRQEEFFQRFQFTCSHMLALSSVEPLTLGELERLAGPGPEDAQRIDYTEAPGMPELRAAIAARYPGATADNVVVTVGVVEALLILLHLLLDDGDEVVCLWPAYEQLTELVTTAGAHTRHHRVDPASPAPIDLDALLERVTARTRLVLLNVPHNPTGRIVPAGELRALATELERRGVVLLVDEVFREMWPDHQPSAWSGAPNVLVTASLSKAYGLAGLRVGWLVGPPELVVEAWRFRNFTTLAPGALDQAWALRALRARERILARSHALVRDGLATATAWLDAHADLFELVPPEGGGLLFPRLRSDERVTRFCERLVEATGVLFAPGSDCYGCEGHVRIGFATSQLDAGLERVDAYLGS